ncbi:hypothetical protein BS47DRAFT_1109010 [Hydnum rufescens UP504]|uniref:Uncharacterized protein n=1 Tax=Hydnum rufescens UP504 TaxID=1448309 RepID=A0A9P6AU99_9AGAM|nr:hypothetical protein BS47DRAFT_1109010 [Hydnum rufescens UP504]
MDHALLGSGIESMFLYVAATPIKGNMLLEFQLMVEERTWLASRTAADIVIAVSMCLLLRCRRTRFQKCASVTRRAPFRRHARPSTQAKDTPDEARDANPPRINEQKRMRLDAADSGSVSFKLYFLTFAVPGNTNRQ